MKMRKCPNDQLKTRNERCEMLDHEAPSSRATLLAGVILVVLLVVVALLWA